MATVSENQRPHFRWVILFTTIVVRFISLIFYSLAPILPLIRREFQYTAAEAGILPSLAMLPGLLLPIPTGILVGRYGTKRLGILALLLDVTGRIVFAFNPYLATMSIGLFLSGIGQQILNIVMLVLIPQWFQSKELGKAIGFNNAAGTGGMVVAMTAVSMVAVTYGWRTPFYIGCFMSIIALIIFSITIREGPFSSAPQEKDQHGRTWIRSGLSNPEVWKVGFYWFLVNVTMNSFITWGPSLFMEFKGLSLVYASIITSVSMIMPSMLMPVFGSLSDRLGKRRVFLIIAASSWVILLPLMALSTSVVELILLVGIYGTFASFMPVCSHTLAAEILGPDQAGIGFAILSVCVSLSGVLGSPITGYVWDTTNSMVTTFTFISIFAATGGIVAALLKTR